ncbi:MAG: hypothetical protein Q8T09_06595 [Candidatus Melainabacteria bacterium]|nr:hypothetical protein [Candidatus Melainabacteria bacterium]
MAKKFWLNHWLHLFLLTALVWLVFSRTIGSYFLADDFGEIAYVNRICSGEINLLWLNFTSNFMSVPGMSVWRPWLLVSLLIDFLIWKANPIGFYLTNLLSYNVTVILLYLLMRQLTESATKARSCLTAFLTAALFAVSPLHCESVSWVVGRVDIVCAVFYLLCLCLFVKADKAHALCNKKLYWRLVAAYLTCFWISIWTKEMTIGAPVLAPALIFLFGSKPLDLKNACKISAPLWLSTALYFVLRYLALGTLLGGYTQGIGDSQAANAISRWLDFDTLRRLFFPFTNGIYGQQPGLAPLLSACYLVILTVLVLRALSLKLSIKWLALLPIWIATCLAPLYKLWGLGYELEGARFCFFLTMPLAALVPALLLIENKKRKAENVSNIERNLTTVGLLATLLAGGIIAKTAIRTNLEWVHAGKEVREFLQQASALNKQLLEQKQEIVLLGIPKRRGGAHMLLNSSTFRRALAPPFTKADLSSQFYTFEPVYFSERFRLDVSRFRELIKQTNQLAYWDRKKGRLCKLNPRPNQSAAPNLSIENNGGKSGAAFVHTLGRATVMASNQNSGLTLTNIQEGDGLGFSQLQLNPLAADVLEAEITILEHPENLKELSFTASFDEHDSLCQITTKQKLPAEKKKPLLIQLPLSQNWRWFTKEKIDSLTLQLPPGTTVQIARVGLLKADQIKPVLRAPIYKQSKDGHYLIPTNKDSIEIEVAMPEVGPIAKAVVYITAKNAFFDTFDNPHDAVEKTVTVPIDQNHSKLNLNAKEFKSDSFRQISLVLLDQNEKVISAESDPIMIQFGDSH